MTAAIVLPRTWSQPEKTKLKSKQGLQYSELKPIESQSIGTYDSYAVSEHEFL